jgi:putative endonuclease
MAYFVYVIRSKKKQYRYVGLSNNYLRRLSEHHKGHNKTTKPYAPFFLILVEEFVSRNDARKREKYLKSGVGREFLDNLELAEPACRLSAGGGIG